MALPLLKPLKEELQRMLKLGVIEKVDQPTEWCHPIVLVRKSDNSIRICIDLTKLNTVTKREFYQLESVDETLAKLGKNCNIMTKLDANSGYWQIPLDENSRLKATFITPFGRFCPTRGPFGLSSMQEIFNKRLDQIIEGLEGVVKSTEDILISGRNMEEHDHRLRALLERLTVHGVTLNTKKCSFRQTKVEFLGHHISPTGIKPLSTKVDAITNFKVPENITELRRFFGMAQQLSKFTPALSTASEPLRDLLSTKNSWVWTTVHQKAFDATKTELAKAPILAHYDIAKPTKIRTDGSMLNGISAILYQMHDDWKPVAFASRYLSDAEKNYHNIEVEMLAVTWGCEKMAKYLHGLPRFTVETDHKPLVPILNYKPLAEMTPRIQRMRMRLLKFDICAQYVKGKDLTDADALSRAPWTEASQDDEIAEKEISAHVAMVIENIPATESRIEEIRQTTLRDENLKSVLHYIHHGWPQNKRDCRLPAQPYWHCHQDLTEVHGLILKGDKIVVPQAMRRDMLQRIHEGHMGIAKCKRRARQCIYWPGINSQIEDTVQGCEECMKLLPSKPADPLLNQTIPERPWQIVGADLLQWSNKTYIVIVDYYSLWPEVYQLSRPDTINVIHAMKETFARHGIPVELISDNGPQFASYKYKQFSNEWQFKHTTSSPHYPRSNGLAEATVKTVKKLLKKCHRSNQDILKGLLILRNTPLQCGKSPAELSKGYPLRDNLPRYHNTKVDNTGRNLQKERKSAKQYHDNKFVKRIPSTHFTSGQTVAIQHATTKEWTLRGKILKEVAPRSFDVKLSDGRVLRRNQRFLRKLHIHLTSVDVPTTIPMDELSDDDSTIAFEESDGDSDETVPYVNSSDESDNICRSRYDRVVKRKHPIDYDEL